MRPTGPAMVLLLTTLSTFAAAAPALDPEAVARRIDPSVVRIFVLGPRAAGSGSGIVINSSGEVATNFHVVAAHVTAGWQVFIADGGMDEQHRRPATVVQTFPDEDLAILRVEGLDRPPAEFADTADGRLEKGTVVYVVGFPGAGDRLGPVTEASFAPGTVSRLFDGSWSIDGASIPIVQHTAPTNPGNSGGPLVDGCGRVVGINTQREAQMVVGPGGIPLVTDPVQGVFYASDAAVLLRKLRETGITFTATAAVCRANAGIFTGATAFLAGIVLLLAASTAYAFVFRPRPVVNVVVRCGDIVDACVAAVQRAIGRR